MQVVTEQVAQRQWKGQRVRRLEDPRLITGADTFLDNLKLPHMLYASFVRSPYAAAGVRDVDLTDAARLSGFAGGLTGREAVGLAKPLETLWRLPGIKVPPQPALAADQVRYVGEPVAVVAATDRYRAEDIREAVNVAYNPSTPVIDAEEALAASSARVHDGFPDNLAYQIPMRGGDVETALRESALMIDERLRVQRLAASAMETRGVLATYNPAGELTLWSSTQWPHILRTALATSLGLGENRVRVIAPDVGGGFGPKGEIYVEEVAISVLAIKLGRPVKWVETRRESYLATTHSRDQTVPVQAGFSRDGLIRGLKARLVHDFGAYLMAISPGGPFITALSLNGPYRLRDYGVDVIGVFTNKVPSSAYRGFGQPEAAFVLERVMNIAADELHLDPTELRLRNLITPDQFPYHTMTGGIYDSGDYPACLRRLLQLLDYDGSRAEQARRRSAGEYIGIGIAIFGETSGFAPSHVFSHMGLSIGGYDSALVRMDPAGKVTVVVGTSPHGQGLETTLAQVTADELGVTYTDVTVLHGDTSVAPYGQGTFGSRSMSVSGPAVLNATQRVREKMLQIAAILLKADAKQLALVQGAVIVQGNPERRMTIADVAKAAYTAHVLPRGMEPGLEATSYYDPAGLPTSYAAHGAVVQVDVETGSVRVERYAVVHDCGKVINPEIVEGQIHGAVVQGIGQALLEELVYDQTGQLLSASFVDYLLPTAMETGAIAVEHHETPTPLNPLGVKGMGEGGTIVAPAALANAVADALAPLRGKVTGTPLKPEVIWQLVRRKGSPSLR